MQRIADGEVRLVHVPDDENPSDFLTKWVPAAKLRASLRYATGAAAKPKHHFATHVPIDVLRFGPPRGFWCMSFEGFNKIVKQATEISNYRQEDLFVLEHWMLNLYL